MMWAILIWVYLFNMSDMSNTNMIVFIYDVSNTNMIIFI